MRQPPAPGPAASHEHGRRTLPERFRRSAAVLGAAAACVAGSLLLGGTTAATGHPLTSPPRANEGGPSAGLHAVQPWSLGLPLRLAFYYPSFPEAWRRPNGSPGTNSRYRPSLGAYNSGDPRIVRRHVAAMRHGRIQGGIVSWWGPRSRTDRRLPRILRAAAGSPVRFAVHYEKEWTRDPSPASIAADLTYIRRRYFGHPNYLRISGRFVVFVNSRPGDGCAAAVRWLVARVPEAYVVLKAFPGHRRCRAQPDGWIQYSPAAARSALPPYSFSISPGLFKASDRKPRLARSVARFRQSALRMARSGAQFQLITTFNEWVDGSAVESATAWPSRSGFGRYLDVLHAVPLHLPPSGPRPPAPNPPLPPVGDVAVVAAAGDMACDPNASGFNNGLGSSSGCRQKYVSDLVVGGGYHAFLALGDNQYEQGEFNNFLGSYDPSYGRVKAITRPAVGNHEYGTSKAAGYFQYFGAAAGDPAKGYYSFDLGRWHLIALNSNCGQVGGCGAGSPQHAWLVADLAAHPARCTLAYMHHPRFSSGENYFAGTPSVEPLWTALYDAGADVVLSGHEHVYERFAPQSPTGVTDPARGIRQFTVGTGGKNLSRFRSIPRPNSEARNGTDFGILRLTLRPDRYDWQFVPEAGKTFTDSGSTTCH